jgi:hypothetical protein
LKDFGFFLEDSFEDYNFAWGNICIFKKVFFCLLKIFFNVNGKATMSHTHSLFSFPKGRGSHLYVYVYLIDKNVRSGFTTQFWRVPYNTWKCPSMREWILLVEGLPTVVRMHPDLLATFSFYFILFITYKIIQYSRTVAGKWKHCITTLVDPYFSRAF